MAKITLPTDNHTFDISNDTAGNKRQVILSKFMLDVDNKQFLVSLILEFSLPKKVITDEVTGDYYFKADEYESKENRIVLARKEDTFIGDTLIMVYFNPENPSDPRNGQILNPDRNPVTEDVPYTSQYEFIYTLFSGGCVPLELIEGLVNSWNDWANLNQ